MQREKWLAWANELQAIAQAGLYYGHDVFDRERYERIRQISAEIVGAYTDLSVEEVQDLFCTDSGYLTPKLDTRAVIFENDRILLVKEATGQWALPGGWVELDRSVPENAVKEAKEEAGLDVVPERLIALLDRDKHNKRLSQRKIMMAFVQCRSLGGQFVPNSETVEAGYFSLDELPSPLALTKTTEEELRMCFEAMHSDRWQTVFD